MCNYCTSPIQTAIYHTTNHPCPMPDSDYCTASPVYTHKYHPYDGTNTSRSRRAKTTSTSSYHCTHAHMHTHNQETIQTTSPICHGLNRDKCGADRHCTPSWCLAAPSRGQNTRIEALLRELLEGCIEDEVGCCGGGGGTYTCDRCAACEQDRQTLVCEVFELLDRIGAARGTGRGRRCGCGCGVEQQQQDGKSELQALFEVLFRVMGRMRDHQQGCGVSWSRGAGCSGGCDDAGLQVVVRRLCDELEEGAGWGEVCQGCCGYVEGSLKRLRRSLGLGEDEARGGGGRGKCGCGGGSFGGVGGCAGCSSSVSTKIVYERPGKRSRSGNVHVGWSLR